jgi:hypothetical protein
VAVAEVVEDVGAVVVKGVEVEAEVEAEDEGDTVRGRLRNGLCSSSVESL